MPLGEPLEVQQLPPGHDQVADRQRRGSHAAGPTTAPQAATLTSERS
jgi:hypothetical protein